MGQDLCICHEYNQTVTGHFLCIKVSLHTSFILIDIILYIFLADPECDGHSFAYVAHL
jgi:hypothetical protein